MQVGLDQVANGMQHKAQNLARIRDNQRKSKCCFTPEAPILCCHEWPYIAALPDQLTSGVEPTIDRLSPELHL